MSDLLHAMNDPQRRRTMCGKLTTVEGLMWTASSGNVDCPNCQIAVRNKRELEKREAQMERDRQQAMELHESQMRAAEAASIAAHEAAARLRALNPPTFKKML